MPSQSVAELQAAVKKATDKVAAIKQAKKVRRESRRKAIAAQPAPVRAILYSLVPQTRRHVAKMVKKQRAAVLRTGSLIAKASDEKSKAALAKKMQRQAATLAGLVESLKQKRARKDKAVSLPTLPVITGQLRRPALAQPPIDQEPDAETVALLIRLVATLAPRKKGESAATAHAKVRALAKRALSRYYLMKTQVPARIALRAAATETVNSDLAAIMAELRQGGLRQDPASDSVGVFIDRQGEDVLAACEDLQREQFKAPAGKELDRLLGMAAKESQEVLREKATSADEVIQDVLLADLPVQSEGSKKKARKNTGEEPVPFYQQPAVWLVAGVALVYFWSKRS